MATRKTAGSRKTTTSRKSSTAGKGVRAAGRSSSKQKASSKKKALPERAASKRTLVEPHPGDKRYVRRDAQGEFKNVVDVGRSLAADRRTQSKTAVKKGQGDRGDVKR